jgi:hypothetical protein
MIHDDIDDWNSMERMVDLTKRVIPPCSTGMTVTDTMTASWHTRDLT